MDRYKLKKIKREDRRYPSKSIRERELKSRLDLLVHMTSIQLQFVTLKPNMHYEFMTLRQSQNQGFIIHIPIISSLQL